eukprot:gnl/MRDRNA2_/MRDRNA2_79995_c0_seq2.p1 gnl/MRDRNA2_/MRDRNA2_79995_c0~~gnl/MRDRNA2_/MRDRNA2_79995_c0_seq2.p1  ORF type:complete len:357 (+),score=83.78 gnl/MRDRNA2_/MRDRNA2_79995_c0_seq2:91-1071(+)
MAASSDGNTILGKGKLEVSDEAAESLASSGGNTILSNDTAQVADDSVESTAPSSSGNAFLSKSSLEVSDGADASTVASSSGNTAFSGGDRRNRPAVRSIDVDWGIQHPYLIMVSAPIAENMQLKQMMEVAAMFPMRPKAMSAEIASIALEYAKSETSSQCTVCALCFLRPVKANEKTAKEIVSVGLPPKKQKTGPKTESMLLRHILVKHKECKNKKDLKNKEVTRTKAEAESMLRKALKELHESGEDKVEKPEKTTPTFEKICKEISDCQTALKGGVTRGDLGWMNKDQITSMGADFEQIANALPLATWSDIAYSNDGCHIILRIA